MKTLQKLIDETTGKEKFKKRLNLERSLRGRLLEFIRDGKLLEPERTRPNVNKILEVVHDESLPGHVLKNLLRNAQ